MQSGQSIVGGEDIEPAIGVARQIPKPEPHPDVTRTIFGEGYRKASRFAVSPSGNRKGLDVIGGTRPTKHLVGPDYRNPHIAARVFKEARDVHARKTIARVVDDFRMSLKII